MGKLHLRLKRVTVLLLTVALLCPYLQMAVNAMELVESSEQVGQAAEMIEETLQEESLEDVDEQGDITYSVEEEQNERPYPVVGDTNGDGIVDLIDLSNIMDWFGIDNTHPDWYTFYIFFDFNDSGEIDMPDITFMNRLISGNVSAPTVSLSVDKSNFIVSDEAETVYFYAAINGQVTSVSLVDSGNNIVAVMRDDGLHEVSGDDVKNDGIFTCKVNIDISTVNTLTYRAVAKNNNVNTTSNAVSIYITADVGFDWSPFMPYENMTEEEQTEVIVYLQYAVFPMMLLYDMDPLEFDWEADYDDDGLTNLQEYEHDTNPFNADTDGDGLTDYEEIFTYNTNPLKADTDDDGLSDGLEILYGMNPNNPDTLSDGTLDGARVFTVTKTGDDWSEADAVKPILEIQIPGNRIENLYVDKVPETDVFLTPDIPGYVGNAYDIETGGDFGSATLTFEFDADLWGDPNFVPAIYYWNEEIQLLEELPNQTISGNTVTAAIEESCKYILLDKTIFDKAILNIHAYEIGDPGQLTGRVAVANANGTASRLPVSAQVKLLASPDAPEPLQTTTTDTDGYYSFEDVEPGRYYLELSATGYISEQIYNITVWGGTETYANRVEFVPSSASNGTVSGSVLDIVTNLPTGSAVTLEFRRGIYYNLDDNTAPSGGFAPFSIDPDIIASVTPGANGQFSVSLPPGNYTVTARSEWYEKSSFFIALRGGSTLSFSPFVTGTSANITKKPFEGHTYAAFDRSMTWHNAKEYCESLGGHLATVTSSDESGFVISIAQAGSKNWYYLGGTDEGTDDEWRWVTSEPWGFENFASGEPNNQGGYESYIMLYSKISPVGKWNDTNADNRAYNSYNVGFTNGGFICEWDYIYDGSEPPKKEWYTLHELMSDIDKDALHDFWEQKVNSCQLTDGAGRPLWRTPDQKLSWDDINNQDSDGDGINDGVELKVEYRQNLDGSYNVWAHMYSNPCLADSDGDGIDDSIDPNPMVSDLELWTANDDWSNEIRAKALAIQGSGYAHWGINPAQITQYDSNMFLLGIMYGINDIDYWGLARFGADMPKSKTYYNDLMFMLGKIYAGVYLNHEHNANVDYIIDEIKSKIPSSLSWAVNSILGTVQTVTGNLTQITEDVDVLRENVEVLNEANKFVISKIHYADDLQEAQRIANELLSRTDPQGLEAAAAAASGTAITLKSVAAGAVSVLQIVGAAVVTSATLTLVEQGVLRERAADKISEDMRSLEKIVGDIAEFVETVRDDDDDDDPVEIYYRTMSLEHYNILAATGQVTATSETFISRNINYSSQFDGVLVKFKTNLGTHDQLAAIGYRDNSDAAADKYPLMPIMPDKNTMPPGWSWIDNSAYFKGERVAGDALNVNIGLGKGVALSIFNANIIEFEVILR